MFPIALLFSASIWLQNSEKDSGLQSLSHKLNVRDAEIKELKEKLNLLKNNELDSVKVVKLNYLNLNQSTINVCQNTNIRCLQLKTICPK